MNSNLKKDKYVAVIELSSTAVKTIMGLPQYVNREKQDINRFESFPIIPSAINTFIINNTLEIKKFEKRILPEVLKIAKRLSTKPLQAVRIIFTGHYRTITNFKALKTIIVSTITKYIRLNKCTFELLSPEEESYLSFFSWFTTVKLEALNTTYNDLSFFIVNTGLHIDIGGGSTEITVIKGRNFSNTISIPFGTASYKDKILKERFLDNHVLNSYSEQIYESVKNFLADNFIETYSIKFCISTGSFNFIGFQSDENVNKLINSFTVQKKKMEARHAVKTNISPYLENNEPIVKWHQDSLLSFIGLSILHPILRYFSVESYYVNRANLRIGAYHDLCEKIKGS